jgi:hypothetical protein
MKPTRREATSDGTVICVLGIRTRYKILIDTRVLPEYYYRRTKILAFAGNSLLMFNLVMCKVKANLIMLMAAF